MRLSPELRDRAKGYASTVIKFYVSLPGSRKEVRVLDHQLFRFGTSVAAHIREASRGRSDAEFCSKLDAALQEADESGLWLELLRNHCGINGKQLNDLVAETDELMSIFVTMVNRTRRRVR